MALSAQTYQGDGSNTDFVLDFTLGYISESHIHVYVDDVEIPQNTLQFILGGGSVRLPTAPASGSEVLVRRIVPNDKLLHDYENGSLVIESNLDESNLQSIMLQHEAVDGFSTGIYGDINFFTEISDSPEDTAESPRGVEQVTITGLASLSEAQRDQFETSFNKQHDQFEATFNSQFTYKRIGNISDYAGQSLPKTDKLNSYQYPDDSGEWYAPMQGQTFPITIPAEPTVSDSGWVLTLSPNIYRGLWPDTGGSANKGETWQTQVEGTPTGQYFTALQNTTAYPIGDDVNWREVVSRSNIGSQEVTATGSTTPRTLADRFADTVNVKDFGAVGDGIFDNTSVFEALSDGSYFIPDGDYVLDGATLPSTLRFVMGNNARFVTLNNLTNINSVVDATNQPVDWTYVNNCKVNQVELMVGVGKEFSTIQEAIDYVPSNMWQRFVIRVSDGDYSSEHLQISGKHARTTNMDIDNSIPGEHTGLFLAGNTASPDNVQVGSVLAVSCTGATFQPQLSGFTVADVVQKTNEGASIEFYGCSNGAILDVNFSAAGADKAIMSYSSSVSVEGVDFGVGLYNDLFVAKHGGTIWSNGNTRTGEIPSPVGTAIRYISNPIGGAIYFNDMSGLKSQGFARVRLGGNMNGFTYDTGSRAFYGPATLEGAPSAYQTYFTNLDNFTHTESLTDSTTTIDETRGLNLHCGSVPNAFSQAFVRRQHTLSTQDIIRRQQLKGAVYFPSMSGAFLEFGIGSGNGRVYIEVTPTTVRGVFINLSGVATSTTICDTSAIVGDNCVFDISVERNNTTASTQLADVRFKISTDTFETYKSIHAVSGSTPNQYEWFTKLQSIDGMEQDVYLGELALYRE